MSYAFGCMRRPLALQAQSRRVWSLEGNVAFVNPTFYRAETEALDAPNVPQVELVLRQAAGPLLEAYHVIIMGFGAITGTVRPLVCLLCQA